MGVFTRARTRTVVLAATGLVIISGQAASAAPDGLRVDRDNIYQDGYRCDQHQPYALLPGGTITLQARAIDPANSTDINHRFVLWPVNRPDAKTELNAVNFHPGFVASVDVPQTVLQHGQTYVWRVQVSKGDQTSPWSRWCVFTVDSVNPATPEVTYPEELLHGYGPGSGSPAAVTAMYGASSTAGTSSVCRVAPSAASVSWCAPSRMPTSM